MQMPARTAAALAFLLAMAFAPAAGQERRGAEVVRVAAASDLRFVIDDAVRDLAVRRPPLIVQPTYGSSGSLHAQLQQRAPFDVFLSADLAYPADLVKRGVGTSGDLFTYAVGSLVIWTPNGSTLPVDRQGLRALEQARHVAIANPALAPYGRAARTALVRAGLWERMQPRLVFGENIAQAAQFVESGAADAGLLSKSLAFAAPMQRRGRWWPVPESAHEPLVQGGLILPGARSRPAAEVLRDYLLGENGRRLLSRHGFGVPPR